MKDIQFTCNTCNTIWNSSEYPEDSNEYNGYNCPDCLGKDISGEDIKN